MIKARAGNHIILGLSRKNIEKLMEGKPIKVQCDKLGLPFEIFIFFGETEKSMTEELKELFTKETTISDSRPN